MPLSRMTPVATAAACLVLACPPLANAASTTYATLHSFQVADGFAAYGELVQASNGIFYGTTYTGGANDAGTVFRAWTSGKFSVLHDFTKADGQAPAGGLTLGTDGNLYGVTGGGGAFGQGAAFKLTPSGTYTLLHSFGGPANDGSYPYLGRLVQASDGNFYGTTLQGGAHGLGVAFRMTPAGAVTVLHAFAGGASDGASPRGGLVMGSDGLLHGTTLCGGVADTSAGCGGTIFSLSTSGSFTITHRFAPNDAPQAPLIEAGGLLYGTTSAGGAAKAGTVFKSTLDGHSFFTVHEFAPSPLGQPRTSEGAVPLGRLLLANDGNLYGTTHNGASQSNGTVFTLPLPPKH
ncbi:MAG TPA: choice-of-anchor tandem repeat GloVer-containing protein [Burkholderiaceae bacterium]